MNSFDEKHESGQVRHSQLIDINQKKNAGDGNPQIVKNNPAYPRSANAGASWSSSSLISER